MTRSRGEHGLFPLEVFVVGIVFLSGLLFRWAVRIDLFVLLSNFGGCPNDVDDLTWNLRTGVVLVLCFPQCFVGDLAWTLTNVPGRVGVSYSEVFGVRSSAWYIQSLVLYLVVVFEIESVKGPSLFVPFSWVFSWFWRGL